MQLNNQSSFTCFRGSGRDWPKSTKWMEIAMRPAFLSTYYTNAASAQNIFVRVMSTVLNPQIICLRFPQVALPWSGKENLVGVVPPSVEAFSKSEDNSGSIQFTDCWHCTEVTNRLSSKRTLERAVYTPTAWTCYAALRSTIPMTILPKKVFAGVSPPVNSPEVGESHATVLLTHYPNAKCSQPHFHWCDVNIVDTPKSLGYMLPTQMVLPKSVKYNIKLRLFCVQLRHLKLWQ